MSKTLVEMTPEERSAAIKRATTAFQAELDATADQIGTILDEPARRGWPGDHQMTSREIGPGDYEVNCTCEAMTFRGDKAGLARNMVQHQDDVRHAREQGREAGE
jgi:hypothetical protein